MRKSSEIPYNTPYANVCTDVDGRLCRSTNPLYHVHPEYLTEPQILALIPAPGSGVRIIGEIIMYPSTNIPDGWLLCNGQAVSRSVYTDLFALLQEVFGPGDGSTTFNIPDYRGVVPLGVSESHALATTGGSETVTLDITQIPTHGKHGVANANIVESGSSAAVKGNAVNLGGGLSHPNMPPYLTIHFCIYTGVAI